MARKRKIRVKLRKLGREKAVGLAYQNCDFIELDERVRPKMLMVNALHEINHLTHVDDSEYTVEKNAQIMANVLWDVLGFRRVYSENKPMKPKSKRKQK